MKERIAALCALALALTVRAQGTVNFANLSPGAGLNAPIYLSDGVTRATSSYTAELLAGPQLNLVRSLATTTFLSGAPGYFVGGTVTVSNVAPGATAWCVLQVWLTQAGSFSNAYATFQPCTASGPFKVVTGGYGSPPTSPAALLGITNMNPAGGLGVWEEPGARLHLQLSNTNMISLTWTNYPVTGWRYSLQQNPDLNPLHWAIVTNGSEVNASLIQVNLPAPKTNTYFRLLPNF